jgi:hypothetical protein
MLDGLQMISYTFAGAFRIAPMLCPIQASDYFPKAKLKVLQVPGGRRRNERQRLKMTVFGYGRGFACRSRIIDFDEILSGWRSGITSFSGRPGTPRA